MGSSRRHSDEVLVDLEKIDDRLKPCAQVPEPGWHWRLGVLVVHLVRLRASSHARYSSRRSPETSSERAWTMAASWPPGSSQ